MGSVLGGRRLTMGLLLAGCLLVGVRPSCAQAPQPKPDQPFAPQSLPRIEPGTQVADRAPANWSQLIIKSQPKVTAGDIQAVPAMTIDLVDTFFTAILARVEPLGEGSQRRFALARVAIGLGTQVRGRDIIISSATYRDLGAKLGLVGGIVLSKSEEQFDQILEIAHSSTMSLIDVPTVFARGAKHVACVLRYAVLADPRDGRIYTLAWLLEPAGANLVLVEGTSERVQPGAVAVCPMRVDASKFNLGMPSPDAFAVLKMPPGEAWPLPPEARATAVLRRYTPLDAHQLEVSLWSGLFPAQR